MRCIAVACVRVLKTESENNDREFMFCSWQCCEKHTDPFVHIHSWICKFDSGAVVDCWLVIVDSLGWKFETSPSSPVAR